LVKISRNSMLKNRVQKLRAEVKVDTQKLRNQAIEDLQELFTLAKEQAQDPNVKLKQRQAWTRVATYICQVINTVAVRFDERQIDIDLNKLEELINETTTKNKTQTT
jgi:ribosomal protein L17